MNTAKVSAGRPTSAGNGDRIRRRVRRAVEQPFPYSGECRAPRDESPLPWVLQRNTVHPVPDEDPAMAAERFFRRIMSDRAWERLGENQRESRRLDGATLLNDLRTVRNVKAPFDLSTLRVPATYVNGDIYSTEYFRALSGVLVELNPRITIVELEHAGHDAHLKNTAQLAAVIEESWDAACA